MSSFVRQKGRYFFLSNSHSLYRSATGTVPVATKFFVQNGAAAGVLPTALTRVPTVAQLAPSTGATLRSVFFPFTKFPSPASKTPTLRITILKRAMATHRETGGSWRSGGGSGGYGSSKFRRIVSYLRVPLAFTAGVLAFNAIVLPFAFQIPGVSTLQRRPELLVYGLMAANVAVFAAWKAPRAFGRQLYRYGLLHKDAQFNKWSMLGSAFSHQELWHLGINMFVLYQFGIPLAKWVGGQSFLEMYLGGAVLSSLGSMALPVLANAYTPWAVALANVPSLGASGAIFTVFGAFSYLVPYARLSLFFVPLPIGAWYVFLLTMGYNGLGMFYRFGMSDYAGHFAGSAVGILWGWIFSERVKKQRQVTLRRYGN